MGFDVNIVRSMKGLEMMRPLKGGKHSKSTAIKRNSSHNNMRGQSVGWWEERRLHVSIAVSQFFCTTRMIFSCNYFHYTFRTTCCCCCWLDVDRLTRPSDSQGFHSLSHSDRRQPQAQTLSATPPTVFGFLCPPDVKTRNEAEFNCERRFCCRLLSPNVRLMIQRKIYDNSSLL